MRLSTQCSSSQLKTFSERNIDRVLLCQTDSLTSILGNAWLRKLTKLKILRLKSASTSLL